MSWKIASCVALGLVMSGSSAFAASTLSKGEKAAWKKALNGGGTTVVSMSKLGKLGLGKGVVTKVKAAIKKNALLNVGPEQLITMKTNAATGKKSFAVQLLDQGAGDDFVAETKTLIFAKKTGALLGAHDLVWDQNGTIRNAWSK